MSVYPHARRYNSWVPASSPQPARDPAPPVRPPKPHIYGVEATGLLVIAALILALTLIRYWHHIPWNWR